MSVATVLRPASPFESEHAVRFQSPAHAPPAKSSSFSSAALSAPKMADIVAPKSPCPPHDDLGVSVGWEHLYEGFPITIRQTKGRGRIVVATRDIKAGEVILRSMHYTTTVSDEFKTRVCSGCWTMGHAKLTTRCEICQEVYYCSPICQENAEHPPLECHALRSLHRQGNSFTDDQFSEIRMAVKMLAKRQQEQITGRAQHQKSVKNFPPSDPTAQFVRPPMWEDVCRLVPNASNFSPEIREDVKRMTAMVRKLLPSGELTEDDVANLFFREKCNCFGIWDTKDRCLASALFPLASFFNHSCVPNCTRFPDITGCISIRALYPIPAGNELTISYITIKNVDTDARQLQLSGYYCFECGCHRCRDTTATTDNFVEKFLCKRDECTGMILPPDGEKRCRVCSYEEPFDYATLFPANFLAPHHLPSHLLPNN